VRDGRPRVEPDPAEAEALADAFFAAVVEGEVDRLTDLLTDDVVFLSDGGKDRHAARRPVIGPDKVARLFVNIARRDLEPADELHQVVVNGQHGGFVVRDGEPFLLTILGWRDGLLAEAISILEPGKLARFHEHWRQARDAS
jgi:RNA polymerase sigma-70 factor (ECF subfamily)